MGEGTPAVFASFLCLLKLHLRDAVDSASHDACGAEKDRDDVSPVDIMGVFVKRGLQTVTGDFDSFLQQTRDLLPCVPLRVIGKLRHRILEEDEDGGGPTPTERS